MKRFRKKRGAASFTALRANVACYSSEFTRPTVPQLEAADQAVAAGLCIVVPFLALPLAAFAGLLLGVG